MNQLKQPRYDSRTWTGLYHHRFDQKVRLSRALGDRLVVYLGTGFKIIAHKVFQHGWNWWRDECDVCGLTWEQSVDHSWRALPRGVAVRV